MLTSNDHQPKGLIPTAMDLDGCRIRYKRWHPQRQIFSINVKLINVDLSYSGNSLKTIIILCV